MHVMRVSDFLALTELRPHQELVAQGLVVPLDVHGEHSGAIINFVSHQWLGFTTADPRGDHLRTMQDCFRRVAEGTNVFKDEDAKAAYFTGFTKRNATKLHVALWATSIQGEVTDEQFRRTATDGWVWMVRDPALQLGIAPVPTRLACMPRGVNPSLPEVAG